MLSHLFHSFMLFLRFRCIEISALESVPVQEVDGEATVSGNLVATLDLQDESAEGQSDSSTSVQRTVEESTFVIPPRGEIF